MEEDTQKDKYMTFESGEECYAIAIQYVNEIISFQQITMIPETEEYIKGLINLRGKIIPVVDVRLRFKLSPCLRVFPPTVQRHAVRPIGNAKLPLVNVYVCVCAL